MPNSGMPRRDAGHRQRERDLVAVDVGGLVPLAGIDAETGRMDVGAGAGEHDAVDHVEQRTDVGDIRRAREHQRQAAGDLGHGAQVPLADHLHLESIFDALGVPDHADDRLFHLLVPTSSQGKDPANDAP